MSGALGESVPNPFLGQPNVTGGLSTGATTTVFQLMQAYPQYTAVTQALVPGASASFNELMARFYIRQAYGMTLNVNYEYSRNLITGQLTPGGPLSYQESTSDYPHRLSITGGYSLPLGHGKRFLNHGGVTDMLVGGLKLNTIYQMLSGTPIQFGLEAAGGPGFGERGEQGDDAVMALEEHLGEAVGLAVSRGGGRSQRSS